MVPLYMGSIKCFNTYILVFGGKYMALKHLITLRTVFRFKVAHSALNCSSYFTCEIRLQYVYELAKTSRLN
jgi:hypothetical protein